MLKNNINPQQIQTARLCTSVCQGIDGFADCQVKIQTEKHFFILQEITATNQKDDSVMATFKITQKFSCSEAVPSSRLVAMCLCGLCVCGVGRLSCTVIILSDGANLILILTG